MAISTIARFDGYSYIYQVQSINEEVINESKKRFNALKQKDVIKNQSYDDTIWTISDEVYTCSINFSIDETEYAKHCKKVFNCSSKHFKTAMRVLITSYFGSDVMTLRRIATVARKLVNIVAGKVNLDELSGNLSSLIDLLSLLPGESIQYDKLVDDL